MLDIHTVIEDLRSEMALAGISYTGPIEATGKLKRFSADGEKGLASWYVLYTDGVIPAGAFGCWRRGISIDYKYTNGHSNFSKEELAELRAKMERAKNDRRTEEEKRISEAKLAAATILSSATPAAPDNPYLQKKRCGVFGEIRQNIHGELVLPLRDSAGALFSLQLIAPEKRYGAPGNERDKDFLPGGRIQGCFYTVSDRPDGPLVICEGYATGASIHEATGYATICAMSASNLKPVAAAMRAKFPARMLVIASDNDRFTDKNPGVVKANEAAKPARASVAVPEFADEDASSTDFNDLACTAGLEAVAAAIRSALPVVATPIGQLIRSSDTDPNPSEILKYRYLCRKMALLFVGPTGKGKSSALLQALACFAVLRPFFGIVPAFRVRSVYIQAENDEDDIAAIRDGICQGLQFNEEERRLFFDNVLCYTETCLTGKRFCNEVVKPLIELHKADIVAIDPVLSYIGGDAKEQTQVGTFLRNQLAPVLSDTNAGSIINHHTNKIGAFDPNADKNPRDFAYYGSGSAEWANWPRAILALEPTKTKGVFRLHAAKRGQKLHWFEPDAKSQTSDNPPAEQSESELPAVQKKPLFSKLIGHSTDPSVIYWRDASEDEVPAKKSKSIECDPEELAALLKGKKLSSTEWQARAKDEYGISRATFFRVKKLAVSKKLVSLSPLDDKWFQAD